MACIVDRRAIWPRNPINVPMDLRVELLNRWRDVEDIPSYGWVRPLGGFGTQAQLYCAPGRRLDLNKLTFKSPCVYAIVNEFGPPPSQVTFPQLHDTLIGKTLLIYHGMMQSIDRLPPFVDEAFAHQRLPLWGMPVDQVAMRFQAIMVATWRQSQVPV
jgi:hypothetical protein